MNLKPSGVGWEPKKVVILAVLVVSLAYFLWPSSSNQGPAPVSHSPRAVAPPPLQQFPRAPAESRSAARKSNDRSNDAMEEFRPSLRKVRLANTDPSRVDPTLRLDMLARLQNVKLNGGLRSLFEASDTPPPAIVDVKVPVGGKVRTMAQAQKPTPPPGPPPPPPPPPIPLKFYGFVNPDNKNDRRAFFLDGEDILVAAEGDTLDKRYKVIRIGVSQAVVEDTQFNDQQKLDLVAEAPPSSS